MARLRVTLDVGHRDRRPARDDEPDQPLADRQRAQAGGHRHLPGGGAQGEALAVVVEQPQARHAAAQQLDGGADDALQHLIARQRGGQPLRQPRQRLEPAALLLGLGQQRGAGHREAHLMGDALEQREQVVVEGPRPGRDHRQHAPHVVVDEDRQRQLGVKLPGIDGARSTGSLTRCDLVRSVITNRRVCTASPVCEASTRRWRNRSTCTGVRPRPAMRMRCSREASSRYTMPTGELATPSTTSSVCSAVETRSLLDPIVTAAA